jgi:hypothetical protein
MESMQSASRVSSLQPRRSSLLSLVKWISLMEKSRFGHFFLSVVRFDILVESALISQESRKANRWSWLSRLGV